MSFFLSEDGKHYVFIYTGHNVVAAIPPQNLICLFVSYFSEPLLPFANQFYTIMGRLIKLNFS